MRTNNVFLQQDNRTAKNYALLIGIKDYRHYVPLRTTINDVESIATILAEKYNFETKILKNVNREILINTLAKYRRLLKSNDRLLIYYAGHGVLDQQADEGYWLPIDAKRENYANLVSNSTITSLIKSIPARHVLLIADSCFSGKLTRGIKIEYSDLEYDRISQSRSRSVITSGGLEPVEDGAGRHSIFAKSLLTVLTNSRHKINATKLFYELRRLVILNSDQTPEFADLRKAGHEGGEFVFSNSLFYPIKTNLTQLSKPVLVRNQRSQGNEESPVFTDRLFDGERAPEMIVVPEGSFTMGDIAGKGRENETPLHQVEIDYPFALGRYEVTFSQYDKFATATNRELPDSNGWGRGNRPVINISWEDASAYSQWVSKQTGKKYRLPSEAEWEYAARGGTASIFFWGNHVGVDRTNCKNCQSKNKKLQTNEVGSFQENKFGFFDMLGNASEWTSDCWNPVYNGAPYNGNAWHKGDCSQRVVRGGAWLLDRFHVRVASRAKHFANKPNKVSGFRLAMSID